MIKMKKGLLVLACALSMVLPGLSVSAAENAEEISVSILADCGCEKTIATVSRQKCEAIDASTHRSQYSVTYKCVHGLTTETQQIVETHNYGGYQDKGHVATAKHLYTRSCSSCGYTDNKYLNCYASPSASGGHAVP